jgi:hypothetical protein
MQIPSASFSMSPEGIGGKLEWAGLGLYPTHLSAGLAQKTRELSRSTRVQSIGARETDIITTIKEPM